MKILNFFLQPNPESERLLSQSHKAKKYGSAEAKAEINESPVLSRTEKNDSSVKADIPRGQFKHQEQKLYQQTYNEFSFYNNSFAFSLGFGKPNIQSIPFTIPQNAAPKKHSP